MVENTKETYAKLNASLIRLNRMEEEVQDAGFAYADHCFELTFDDQSIPTTFMQKVNLYDLKSKKHLDVGSIYSADCCEIDIPFNVKGTEFLVRQYDLGRVVSLLFRKINDMEQNGTISVRNLNYFNQFLLNGNPLKLGIGNTYHTNGESNLALQDDIVRVNHQQMKRVLMGTNGLIRFLEEISK